MTTKETVLAVTVDVVSRSAAPEEPDGLPAAIRAAHDAVRRLDAGRPPGASDAADAWDDLVLKSAWEITRAAHRVGSGLSPLLATLASTHAALAAAAEPPTATRRRPRRDA